MKVKPNNSIEFRKELRQHIAVFPLSAVEIVALFQTGNTIEVIKGLPEDAVVTGITRPVNQEAYSVSVYSKEFPESKPLDLIQPLYDDLIQYSVSKDKHYLVTASPYNKFQRFLLRLIRIPV